MNIEDQEKLRAGLEKMTNQCDRCGTCLPHCPLFGIQDRELVGARGKNSVGRAVAGNLGLPAREALEAINFCLLCRACVANCPGGVRTDEIMMDLRRLLIAQTGAWEGRNRLIGFLLGRPLLVTGASAFLSLLRRTGLERIFTSPYFSVEKTAHSYLAMRPGPVILTPKTEPRLFPQGQKPGKVAYFQGCGMKMFFPQAAAATIRILKSITEVTCLRNPCCGLPHLAHGLWNHFVRLSRENRRLFDGFDLIVTDCASCGSSLKHLPRFFANLPEQGEYAIMAAKVMDLSEFLAAAGYSSPGRREGLVTYHDSCHLGRGQGITKEPRTLLRQAGEFVEMRQGDLCCGGAGAFSLDYPEAAAKILEKKQKNIEMSGSSLVVASCPGCVLQLARAARNSGKFQAVHISQVL
jgi:glycolate oxidase iron-sulfur subunit